MRGGRVLERTLPGLVLARLRHIHEPTSGQALTTVPRIREYFRQAGITAETEVTELIALLKADDALDEQLRVAIADWLGKFFRELNDPATTARWPDELSPTGSVMRSLRDVEEQAPIMDRK